MACASITHLRGYFSSVWTGVNDVDDCVEIVKIFLQVAFNCGVAIDLDFFGG